MAKGYFWDGYVHWARALESTDPELAAQEAMPLYEPIFIRLKLDYDETLFTELASFFDEVYSTVEADKRANILADQPEVGFLQGFVFDYIEPLIGFQHALAEKRPPEFFVYRLVARSPEEHNAHADFFDILDVGAPALVDAQANFFDTTFRKGFENRNVLGAIIDNDIGYLHQRFLDSSGQTRIAAVWLQARERLSQPTNPSLGPGAIHIGEVLDGDGIDQRRAEFGRDERRAYAEANAALHAKAAFRQPPPIAAHGAMVMDAAFGADADAAPSDAMADVPILAVQLPPEAARDTSGTVSESYIVQGVRWIGFWARKLNPFATVVLNLSYGVLAGQKDGGKFIEAQIDREVTLAKRYGQTIDVVIAFGNSRNQKQVADLTIDGGTSRDLVWRLPADNAAPAFVEIRASEGDKFVDAPSRVRVDLIDPAGNSLDIAGTASIGAVAAQPAVTKFGGAETARLYNVPMRNFGHGRLAQPGYTLCAVAPTRRGNDGLPTAPAGDWIIRLANNHAENEVAKPVRLILQIQRGDTAPGFRRGGLQSRFEGATHTVIANGVAGQQPVAPLTNAGTNSAFANVAAFHTAGAGRMVFGTRVPADYSGQGADWTTEIAPDSLEEVDRAFARGVLTAGAYSGTYARLSGTSAAAALRSNALVRASLTP